MLPAALFAALVVALTPAREPPACVEHPLGHGTTRGYRPNAPNPNRTSWQRFEPGWGGAEWTRKGDGRHVITECHPLGDRRA